MDDFHIFYPRLVTQTPFENTKIVSHALCVFALDTRCVIVVQRKHSVECLLFLMGHYRPSMVTLLLPNMTSDEHALLLILTQQGKDFYTHVFEDVVGLDTRDLDYGYIRFGECKQVIVDWLDKTPQSCDLKWTWPKGRLSMEDEDDGLVCAKREFVEEVEVELPEAVVVSDHDMVVETIKTLTCKCVETRCWLYVVKQQFDLPPLVDNKEVNDRRWMPIDDALQLLKQPDLMDFIQPYI